MGGLFATSLAPRPAQRAPIIICAKHDAAPLRPAGNAETRESNRGPSDLQSDALPAELSRLVRNAVALTAGALLLIEASAALSCARRLRIRSSWAAQALAISFGRDIGHAETRDRTGDLQIFSLTLSQLSYRGFC